MAQSGSESHAESLKHATNVTPPPHEGLNFLSVVENAASKTLSAIPGAKAVEDAAGTAFGKLHNGLASGAEYLEHAFSSSKDASADGGKLSTSQATHGSGDGVASQQTRPETPAAGQDSKAPAPQGPQGVGDQHMTPQQTRPDTPTAGKDSNEPSPFGDGKGANWGKILDGAVAKGESSMPPAMDGKEQLIFPNDAAPVGAFRGLIDGQKAPHGDSGAVNWRDILGSKVSDEGKSLLAGAIAGYDTLLPSAKGELSALGHDASTAPGFKELIDGQKALDKALAPVVKAGEDEISKGVGAVESAVGGAAKAIEKDLGPDAKAVGKDAGKVLGAIGDAIVTPAEAKPIVSRSGNRVTYQDGSGGYDEGAFTVNDDGSTDANMGGGVRINQQTGQIENN